MSRKTHRNSSFRQQARKSKKGRNDVFFAYRPLEAESAEGLYELMKGLKGDGIIPESAVLTDPGSMHVTYLQKRRLTRELQGYALGFNASEAIARIHNDCEQTRHSRMISMLGTVGLMDRRNNTLAVHFLHNQAIGDEYSVMLGALRSLHVHMRDEFRPHISLARVSGIDFKEKAAIARDVQQVIPQEVTLEPLVVDPPLRRRG